MSVCKAEIWVCGKFFFQAETLPPAILPPSLEPAVDLILHLWNQQGDKSSCHNVGLGLRHATHEKRIHFRTFSNTGSAVAWAHHACRRGRLAKMYSQPKNLGSM